MAALLHAAAGGDLPHQDDAIVRSLLAPMNGIIHVSAIVAQSELGSRAFGAIKRLVDNEELSLVEGGRVGLHSSLREPRR